MTVFKGRIFWVCLIVHPVCPVCTCNVPLLKFMEWNRPEDEILSRTSSMTEEAIFTWDLNFIALMIVLPDLAAESVAELIRFPADYKHRYDAIFT